MSTLEEKYPIGKIFRHVASQRRGVVYKHDHLFDGTFSVHWDAGLLDFFTEAEANIVLRPEPETQKVKCEPVTQP